MSATKQDKAEELAKRVKLFLENAAVIEKHEGKTSARVWADSAQTWLYPSQCWGTFNPTQLQAMFDALEAYENSDDL